MNSVYLDGKGAELATSGEDVGVVMIFVTDGDLFAIGVEIDDEDVGVETNFDWRSMTVLFVFDEFKSNDNRDLLNGMRVIKM